MPDVTAVLTSAQPIRWIALLGSSRLDIKAWLRFKSCSRAPGFPSVYAKPALCSCERIVLGSEDGGNISLIVPKL